MSNATYIDNKKGTIIKTLDNGKQFAYDFLVGKNISKEESIIDYCYNQFQPV